ncbi:MAG: hypothetical protein U5K30_17210 [Acidimicrobiales bacterium]|nr:hypothetical protein [Acidimicrobiales bacterium]
MTISSRLRKRIRHDFTESGDATEAIRLVQRQTDDERLQAAIVFSAGGDIGRLHDAIELADIDWRDALVVGGLDGDDWTARLDKELGPA